MEDGGDRRVGPKKNMKQGKEGENKVNEKKGETREAEERMEKREDGEDKRSRIERSVQNTDHQCLVRRKQIRELKDAENTGNSADGKKNGSRNKSIESFGFCQCKQYQSSHEIDGSYSNCESGTD